MQLSDLGRRIMICGPSSSGKSTLAVAIGRKLGIPAVHLDLFRHLPHTDWVQRPDADFYRLHDEAITADAWVMEGNYSVLMPQRLKRATGIILLGDHRWISLWRYIRRSLMQRDRAGGLDGAQRQRQMGDDPLDRRRLAEKPPPVPDRIAGNRTAVPRGKVTAGVARALCGVGSVQRSKTVQMRRRAVRRRNARP